MLTAGQIRDLLKLRPLPIEGGYFAETYRSEQRLARGSLSPDSEERSLATAIYYLLTPDTFSAMHSLQSDEVFHFYLGDPVEMLQLHPNGAGEVVLLGQDLARGMRPQHVVRAGTWQGSRVCPGGEFALLGATMAPGFDAGDRRQLTQLYPGHAAFIAALTR